jgi:hypothetical protein
MDDDDAPATNRAPLIAADAAPFHLSEMGPHDPPNRDVLRI